jgi:hypothetical protein
MRVMFCQPSSAKVAISGPERQTVQVARALQQRGHQVIVAVIMVNEAEEVAKTTLATHAREHQVGVVSLYLPAKDTTFRGWYKGLQIWCISTIQMLCVLRGIRQMW